MAQVFHRNSGRAWRLRQQSLQLWRDWLEELTSRGHTISRREGLLLLAADPQELERQQTLVNLRRALGFPLELWPPHRLEEFQPDLPAAALGGLYSPLDGQVDPNETMAALLTDALSHGLAVHATAAAAISRRGLGQWTVDCTNGERLRPHWVVLAAGVASCTLAAQLGYDIPMEPVLGQALEFELKGSVHWNWPGAVVWRGLNLVPRPDLEGRHRFWLGATLEPGELADPAELSKLQHWAGAELSWLNSARVKRQWQGWRCRPVGRPAPVLEQLEAGMIVTSGHYRNGVLLAPASARWVMEQVEAGD